MKAAREHEQLRPRIETAKVDFRKLKLCDDFAFFLSFYASPLRPCERHANYEIIKSFTFATVMTSVGAFVAKYSHNPI